MPAQKFTVLREGRRFSNAVEAYLSIITTILAWNMLKLFPMRYAFSDEIAVDYSDEDVYQLAVLGHSTDLIVGACPIAITAID